MWGMFVGNIRFLLLTFYLALMRIVGALLMNCTSVIIFYRFSYLYRVYLFCGLDLTCLFDNFYFADNVGAL